MEFQKIIDISHWQTDPPKTPIEWNQVADDGVKAAVNKVSEGLHFLDNSWPTNYPGMIANDVIPGGYHMFRENVSGSGQADIFLNNVWAMTGNWELLLMIDVERNDGIWQETARDKLRDCLYRVVERTSRIPIIYTSDSKWRELIEYYYNEPAWTTHVPLWVANYNVERPTIPDGWLIWSIWQYTSSGSVTGIDGNVDLNWFRGSMTDLRKLAGIVPDTSDLELQIQRLWEEVNLLKEVVDSHGGNFVELDALRLAIKDML